MMWPLLELGGFDGDGDTDEEDAGHGDGGVAFPVLRPAVRPAGHTPYLVSEISAVCGGIAAVVTVICSSTHTSSPTAERWIDVNKDDKSFRATDNILLKNNNITPNMAYQM